MQWHFFWPLLMGGPVLRSPSGVSIRNATTTYAPMRVPRRVVAECRTFCVLKRNKLSRAGSRGCRELESSMKRSASTTARALRGDLREHASAIRSPRPCPPRCKSPSIRDVVKQVAINWYGTPQPLSGVSRHEPSRHITTSAPAGKIAYRIPAVRRRSARRRRRAAVQGDKRWRRTTNPKSPSSCAT